MRKIVSLLIFMAFTVNVASAEAITKTLTKLGVNKSAISVYIKDVNSGNVVYSLNEKTPM